MGCIVPYLIGGYYIHSYTEDWLYERELIHLDRMLNQIAYTVDESFIKNMENTAALIASDERLVKYVDEISNYTLYDVDAAPLKKSEEENELDRYFENIRATHQQINFIFFGASNGSYVESPVFQPTTNYDPRIRPWYMGALITDEVIISEPYITKFTKDVIVSFTKRISQNGERLGVAGISVKLDAIRKSISDVDFGREGSVILVNNHDTVLISEENPDWTLQTLSQIHNEALLSIDFTNNGHIEGLVNDEQKILCYYTSPYSDWKYIAMINRREIMTAASRMTNILTWIYIITLLIIFIVVYRISKRITTPILEVADHINDLAVFKFRNRNLQYMEAHLKRQDEIGKMAFALKTMQENFLELSNNINALDQEIKQIDITKETNYQLSLSEKNPFNNFTVSVNQLLKRMRLYLSELKKTEIELLEKNQLLTSSEEELLAQLEEIDSQREFINHMAFHDPLTKLPNRRKFTEQLDWAINHQQSGVVILLDIDNFKSINDTLGHVFGDKVLQLISQKLTTLEGESVFVSRFGGDEFLILGLDFEKKKDIEQFAKVISQVFDERFVIDTHEIDIKFSMGISQFPKDSKVVDQLIMNADLALYAVKNRGKNGYALFDEEMLETLLNKATIETALREALEGELFHLVYQPQVDCMTGEVLSYEALIRMTHKAIVPSVFIPVAEENGMIIKIGRLVTRMVIEQLAYWLGKGYPVKPVAINFSVTQIHDISYIDFVSSLLNEYGVSPSLIEIELTENVFIENKVISLKFMENLRELGIRIAIDDFGTGYSSLSYLTFLPIDKIKLDRSLNLKFLEIGNIKVMDSLIQLAHSLNLKVIAEGIETYDHVRKLQVGKCDGIQGYYFSKPLSKDAVESQFYNSYSYKLE
jgi:diguanylate cyclase (GGDEF)-like protein